MGSFAEIYLEANTGESFSDVESNGSFYTMVGTLYVEKEGDVNESRMPGSR